MVVVGAREVRGWQASKVYNSYSGINAVRIGGIQVSNQTGHDTLGNFNTCPFRYREPLFDPPSYRREQLFTVAM